MAEHTGVRPVDIVHLSFLPPHAAGSFNRWVGTQTRKLPGFNQKVVSFSTASNALRAPADPSVILVGETGLSFAQKACLRLPEKIRRRLFDDITGKETLAYGWQVQRVLRQLRPKIVVCYDGYKYAPMLRRVIDWPCRLILSQHGLSYHLPVDAARDIYSLRSFDAVWSLTRASYRFDRARVPGYEPVVTILPNGIDVERFKPPSAEEKAAARLRWNLPAQGPVILVLARLVPKKGAHLILHSLKKILDSVPDAHLWIVGGGDAEYERYLRNMAQSPALSANVRFQGFVPPEETHTCYQAADIYAFPTLSAEGMSMSLLEAMASGLPCVIADHAGAQEMYTPGSVLSVPDPGIEDAFVEPLVSLLKDPGQRARMGSTVRGHVVETFSEERTLAKIGDFYGRQIDSLQAAAR